jgi:hypothetical protein
MKARMNRIVNHIDSQLAISIGLMRLWVVQSHLRTVEESCAMTWGELLHLYNEEVAKCQIGMK